jgi:hypothetical protein
MIRGNATLFNGVLGLSWKVLQKRHSQIAMTADRRVKGRFEGKLTWPGELISRSRHNSRSGQSLCAALAGVIHNRTAIA